MGLASGEPTEHIRNRNPHVADARSAAALARLDGDDVLVVHDNNFSIIFGSAQQRFAKQEGQISPLSRDKVEGSMESIDMTFLNRDNIYRHCDHS